MSDPVSISIGISGATVDLNALMRWFKEAPVRIVAYRFLKVFNDHGVKNTQIPRLIPEVTLDKITDPMSLLPSLTNDVLDTTANLFGVRRAWLDGVDDQIYPSRTAYQFPQGFFDVLGSLSQPHIKHPLRAYCADPHLDRKSGRRQTIVLVFADKIRDWDDDHELIRFTPLTEPWPWNNVKGRMQLKAMLRAAYDHLDLKVVPIIKVDPSTLIALEDGKIVPPFLRVEQEVSLEDFILGPDESKIAKETEELDDVKEYIRHCQYDEMARKVVEQLKKDKQPQREAIS